MYKAPDSLLWKVRKQIHSSVPQTSVSLVFGMNDPQNAKDVAIGALVTALEVTKEVSASFPPLQGVAGSILAIKNVLEKLSSNVDDIEALSKYVMELISMIKTSMPEDYESCPEALRKRIDVLSSDVDAILMGIKNLRSQSRITRIFNAEATSGKMQEYLRQLMWTIHTFIVGGTTELEMAVDELHAVAQEGFEHASAHFEGLEGGMTGVAQQVQNRQRWAELGVDHAPIPRYAESARFDSISNRVVCEESTRMETLATIYHWIKPGDSRLADLTTDLIQQPTERRVLWLDGPAGTGKSTIARTTAAWCDAVGYLGASFFCARDLDEGSDVQLIFPTIAYHLGLYSIEFGDRVADVLRADPDIQDSSVSCQLQKLIVEPLLAVKSNSAFPACAVIIDALDECKDNQSTSIVLKALAHYIDDLDPLKFFITSRPVQQLNIDFRMSRLKDNTQHLAMSSISAEITTRDITQYLQKELADVAHCYHIRNSWPSDDDIAALVHQANGLFIFAATAVRFIQDLRYNDPEAQLSVLLSSQLSTSSTSPYRFLDALYTEVLHTAFPEMDRALKAKLKIVLGSIVLIQDRLPPSSIEALLSLERDTIQKTLDQLRPLVIVPENDNDTIRLIHPSFHDFLTDRSRCTDPNFAVHCKIQHSVLAQHCLRTLQHLRKDICDIGDPSKLNVEVPDLDSRVAKHIPLHLQYACKHWAFHVANAEISEDIYELLVVFATEHMLHWLEALSLLSDIGAGIEGLAIARKALQGLPLPASDVPSLLYDCERIARQFYPCLSVSCLQVYVSVIPFCPIDVRFRRQYELKGPNVATLLSGSQRVWSPCIRIMEGHSDCVQAVGFSPSGEHIVSCGHDRTIRLWDLKTGSHLHTLSGHSNEVNAVAFSPSGCEIVSGSSDRTLIAWDPVTGGQLDKWSMHTGPLRAIAWSPGGRFVGSGSDDCTVIVWDVTTEEPVSVFRGHTADIVSLVFSRHGSLVVSCSEDGTCAVWNLQDASLVLRFLYKVLARSAALSHDDKTIAVGYADAVIALWDMGDGRCIRELRGHRSSVWSVDFSSDDQILVSGSQDNTICLWSISSGTQLVALTGHSDGVRSVQFSPDGSLVCSGSLDHTVRIWEWTDTITAARQSRLNSSFISWTSSRRRQDDSDDPSPCVCNEVTGTYSSSTRSDHHSSSVLTVAFSSNGTVLATGSRGGTVRLWDTSTGTRIQTLFGHKGPISFVAFSPSGKQLSSAGHGDNTVRIWNVKKGQCDRMFEGHTKPLWMVVYAHDEHTLLSCSDDGSLRLWDTMAKAKTARSSGEILYHNLEPIRTICVSPDKRLVLFGSIHLSHGKEMRLRLLDMTTRTVLWMHEGSAKMILSLSFSRDGSRFLSGEADGQICLWDTALALSSGGKNALLEEFHARSVLEHVSFSADQKNVVSDASIHAIRGSEHWPHCAALNNEGSSASPPVYFLFDDWIWRAGPGDKKRICWVPAEYRHTRSMDIHDRGNMAVFRSKIAFGTERGRVVLLDFSNCTDVAELP